MKSLFKNKKVVGAVVALLITLVAVGLGVDFGTGASDAVTNAVCQIISCQ